MIVRVYRANRNTWIIRGGNVMKSANRADLPHHVFRETVAVNHAAYFNAELLANGRLLFGGYVGSDSGGDQPDQGAD